MTTVLPVALSDGCSLKTIFEDGEFLFLGQSKFSFSVELLEVDLHLYPKMQRKRRHPHQPYTYCLRCRLQMKKLIQYPYKRQYYLLQRCYVILSRAYRTLYFLYHLSRISVAFSEAERILSITERPT